MLLTQAKVSKVVICFSAIFGIMAIFGASALFNFQLYELLYFQQINNP